ncbi:recombinase family protein [Glaciimonas sp. GG7]
MIVGYARTSTIDQVADFEAQIEALKKAGCEKLFSEQVSSVVIRAQLENTLDFVREGDVFVVTKLDRLARSIANLMTIIEVLERKHVGVRILNLGMDTETPTGKLMRYCQLNEKSENFTTESGYLATILQKFSISVLEKFMKTTKSGKL